MAWNNLLKNPILPEEITAKKIFLKYRKEIPYIQPQTYKIIYYSCLYIAHIIENNPKTYHFFCKKYSLDRKKLYKYVKKTSLKLSINISMKIENRILNSIKSSGESKSVKLECASLLKKLIQKKFKFKGNYIATTAALIYIVKNRIGDRDSLMKISSKYHIDKGILKLHRNDILNYI